MSQLPLFTYDDEDDDDDDDDHHNDHNVFCMHCWNLGVWLGSSLVCPAWLSSVVLCESVAMGAVMVRSPFGSEYQLTCN